MLFDDTVQLHRSFGCEKVLTYQESVVWNGMILNWVLVRTWKKAFVNFFNYPSWRSRYVVRKRTHTLSRIWITRLFLETDASWLQFSCTGDSSKLWTEEWRVWWWAAVLASRKKCIRISQTTCCLSEVESFEQPPEYPTTCLCHLSPGLHTKYSARSARLPNKGPVP